MFLKNKGQGATEYLVLLAVVLIIALVAIMLLGYFPGMATDARITQSNSYWRGEARPFAIIEQNLYSTGTGSFVLQNVEAGGPYIVTVFQVGSYNNSTNISFSAGEQRIIAVSGMTNGTSGSVYDFAVNITYTTPNGQSSKQYGAKTIVGRYV